MKGVIQAGYGYALSLTHAADEAYDLVYEAWLRLARGGQRRPHQALLFTTIRNLYIDAWRRRRRLPIESFEEDNHGSTSPNEDLALDHHGPRHTLYVTRASDRLDVVAPAEATHEGVAIRLWTEESRLFALAGDEDE